MNHRAGPKCGSERGARKLRTPTPWLPARAARKMGRVGTGPTAGETGPRWGSGAGDCLQRHQHSPCAAANASRISKKGDAGRPGGHRPDRVQGPAAGSIHDVKERSARGTGCPPCLALSAVGRGSGPDNRRIVRRPGTLGTCLPGSGGRDRRTALRGCQPGHLPALPPATAWCRARTGTRPMTTMVSAPRVACSNSSSPA